MPLKLPKLPKLFNSSGLNKESASLGSRVQEWASAAQDLLEALREFVYNTDFHLAKRLWGTAVSAVPPTEGQVLTAGPGGQTASWEDAAAGYTDEEAQDAVGNIMVGVAPINATYDDSTPEIEISIDDFTGDSGAGGAPGGVPAPAAGDAALNKFLHSGGGWATPPGSDATLWDRPASPHSKDWECGDSLPGGWVWYDSAGNVQTPVAAITPYTNFTTAPPKFSQGGGGAWVQAPANSTVYTLTQPYTVPTDAWFAAKLTGTHRGAAINNDSTVLLYIAADDGGGKPNMADSYIYVGIELDAGTYQIDFTRRTGGVTTTIGTTADQDVGEGQVWEYVMIQKVGTTYYAWAMTGQGQTYYLGTTTHASTMAHVGFWFTNVTVSTPAPSLVRIGFFRTKDTASGWPGL